MSYFFVLLFFFRSFIDLGYPGDEDKQIIEISNPDIFRLERTAAIIDLNPKTYTKLKYCMGDAMDALIKVEKNEIVNLKIYLSKNIYISVKNPWKVIKIRQIDFDTMQVTSICYNKSDWINLMFFVDSVAQRNIIFDKNCSEHDDDDDDDDENISFIQ
jgi:hypothetical protein